MKTGSGCGPLCGLGGWFLRGLLLVWVEFCTFGAIAWVARGIWDAVKNRFIAGDLGPFFLTLLLFVVCAVLPGRWALRLWNARQAGRLTCHLLPKTFIVTMALRALLLWRLAPPGGYGDSAPWALFFLPSLMLLAPVLRAWKLDAVSETKAG